jgi:hypothetical protein
MIDTMLAHAIYPARIVCETCPISATVTSDDQARRWLRGHSDAFHDGPFEVGIWTNIEALRYTPEEIAHATVDLQW